MIINKCKHDNNSQNKMKYLKNYYINYIIRTNNCTIKVTVTAVTSAQQ